MQADSTTPSGDRQYPGIQADSPNSLSSNSLANSHPALARLCLQRPWDEEAVPTLEAAEQGDIPLITRVRPSLSLVEGGPGLRHLLWGRFARQFQQFFPELIAELHSYFDYIVIDTPPDYNVLTRSAIASADLVVVPVDASSMSIHCLEELVESSAHIKGPTWSILRTMVNKQASRIQQLSTNRLEASLSLSTAESAGSGIEEAQEFISLLQHESMEGLDDSEMEDEQTPANDDESPIYLLNSVVYRTEQQNKLSFLEKTAFDSRATSKLADQYLAAAKELEEIISLSSSDTAMEVEDDSMSESFFEMRP
jgi:cellulose biosynthesis protein BcsQ